MIKDVLDMNPFGAPKNLPCSQSAPLAIVLEHSLPRSAKSAERIEGAMMAGGDIGERFGRKKCRVDRMEEEISVQRYSEYSRCVLKSIAYNMGVM